MNRPLLEPEFFVYTQKDPEMHSAILEARMNLGVFVEAIMVSAPHHSAFSLKKPFRYDDAYFEDIWVVEVSYDGEKFRGQIGATPEHVQSLKFGEVVSVYPIEVSDWLYLDGKKLVGAYTVELLRKCLEDYR